MSTKLPRRFISGDGAREGVVFSDGSVVIRRRGVEGGPPDLADVERRGPIRWLDGVAYG